MGYYFSPYLPPYRAYSVLLHVLVNVLLHTIEKWKINLDNNFIACGVLMDLSKAFECVSLVLLIAKFATYRFDEKTLLYIYSYLENRKNMQKLANSNFKAIVSAVPEDSILNSIFYSIFSSTM